MPLLTRWQAWRPVPARTLAAVKALLSFSQRTDCLPLNVGAAEKLAVLLPTTIWRELLRFPQGAGLWCSCPAVYSHVEDTVGIPISDTRIPPLTIYTPRPAYLLSPCELSGLGLI